jgi:hypothetical protein
MRKPNRFYLKNEQTLILNINFHMGENSNVGFQTIITKFDIY